MRISELSAQTKVSTHRLRRYESIGLIKSHRQPNGYRIFTANTVREVIFIDMSRKIGFSIDEIADVLPKYRVSKLTSEEMVEHLLRKVQEIDAVILSKQMHRQMLIDHMTWFKVQRRKQK